MEAGHAPARGTTQLRVHRLWVALCTLLLSGGTGAPGPGVTLDGLAAEFASLPGLEARFREERRFAVLAEPLVNEGSLYFAPPRLLLWRVERPIRSELRLRDREVSVTAEGRTQRIDLASEPLARAFVDGFLLLLSGDVSGIRAAYEARIESKVGDERWRIGLVPRGAEARAAIASLEMWGVGSKPEGFGLRLTSGDEIRTRFVSVDVARSFTPAELEEIFQVPPP